MTTYTYALESLERIEEIVSTWIHGQTHVYTFFYYVPTLHIIQHSVMILKIV